MTLYVYDCTMRVIAIGNQKGGVGKTTTTHNLGALLAAEHNQRVLMIDADSQSSLTESCGVQSDPVRHLGTAMIGEMPVVQLLTVLSERLTLIPSNENLAHVEANLVSKVGRENKLHKAIRPLYDDFDICLIDCPPSLSLLTVNALSAASDVLIPTQPQIVDVRGLLRFLDTIDEIKSEINDRLSVIGIVPTFYDGRLTHHKAVIEQMMEGDLPVLDVRIRRSVKITEASAAGVSLLEYDRRHPQLDEYRKLAEIVTNG